MKLSEMREKSVDELQNAIVDWKKQLLESRLSLATNKLENTSSISKTKRLIAQAKTIITEKADCEQSAKVVAGTSNASNQGGQNA
jgi:large subunit ribosomal protein L29